MQNVVIDKPYKFIPPHHGDWVPWLIQKLRIVDWYLKKCEGIESHEVRGIEHLKQSLQAGHGVILAPNHCRYADPIAMGWIAREVDVYIYSMASWHLFHQSRLQALAMQLCGGFSVYREGLDRQSLNTAIDVLVQAKRPLVVFPEGTVFRSNDILQPLLDGVAFLARAAAKRREKHDAGKVVIHPVAIKYLLRGDVATIVEPALSAIEQRLTLDRHGVKQPLLERIAKVNQALLTLQEIKYLGGAQVGEIPQRQHALIEHLLRPLEQKWLGRVLDDTILPRVKQLRSAIVPKLLQPETTANEKPQLWSQLSDIYMAQQIAAYRSDYLDQATNMRLLETVERIEEDVTDRARTHRPLHAILQVGPALEVDSTRTSRVGADPLMVGLAGSLNGMLHELAAEALPWKEEG
jgi:hypothetical protein